MCIYMYIHIVIVTQFQNNSFGLFTTFLVTFLRFFSFFLYFVLAFIHLFFFIALDLIMVVYCSDFFIFFFFSPLHHFLSITIIVRYAGTLLNTFTNVLAKSMLKTELKKQKKSHQIRQDSNGVRLTIVQYVYVFLIQSSIYSFTIN